MGVSNAKKSGKASICQTSTCAGPSPSYEKQLLSRRATKLGTQANNVQRDDSSNRWGLPKPPKLPKVTVPTFDDLKNHVDEAANSINNAMDAAENFINEGHLIEDLQQRLSEGRGKAEELHKKYLELKASMEALGEDAGQAYDDAKAAYEAAKAEYEAAQATVDELQASVDSHTSLIQKRDAHRGRLDSSRRWKKKKWGVPKPPKLPKVKVPTFNDLQNHVDEAANTINNAMDAAENFINEGHK